MPTSEDLKKDLPTQPTGLKKPPAILWVGNQPVPESLTKLGQQFSDRSPLNWITSQDQFQKSDVSGVMIAVQNIADIENPELHHWVQSPFPVLSILASGIAKDFQTLSNRYPWVQYVLEDEPTEAKEKAYTAFLENVLKRQQDIYWGQELTQKTKELENLTSVLEEKVITETATLDSSAKEEKRTLDLNGRLVVYLQDLLKAKTFEESFQAFARTVKSLGVWGECFFLVKKRSVEILVSSGRRREMPPAAFQSSLQQEMAARVGRPLVSPFVEQVYLSNDVDGFIIMERRSSAPISESALEFTQQLKDLLKNSLQSFVLEEVIENTIHQWEVAFDEMVEPIALISENFKLLRANQSFVKNTNWKSPLCYEVFASRKDPCPGCPIVEKKTISELKLSNDTWTVASSLVKEPSNSEKVYIHQYKDRTYEIRLMQQWIQSERLSALGKLAGHVANELNNPIGGIKNQVQVMLPEIDAQSPLAADLIEVEKAATRSLKIISNLLDFSQGKSVDAEFNLKESVDAVFSFLKTSLTGHRVQINLPEEPVQIFGNVQLFQQALFNIINNGIQSMKSKKGTISLDAKIEGSSLVIKITDEGEGIPVTIQKKIFEPFFTTKNQDKGTGLGLALVADVVQQMKGRIYFHSQPGQGTTFSLEVPLRGEV